MKNFLFVITIWLICFPGHNPSCNNNMGYRCIEVERKNVGFNNGYIYFKDKNGKDNFIAGTFTIKEK